MRKSIFIMTLLFIFVVVFGCNTGLITLKPPSWIYGTWADEFDINSWTFIPDDATFTVSGIASIDFKELAKTSGVTLTDSSTDSLYTLTLEGGGTEAGIYRFEKVTATALNFSITAMGVTVGPLLLTKK